MGYHDTNMSLVANWILLIILCIAFFIGFAFVVNMLQHKADVPINNTNIIFGKYCIEWNPDQVCNYYDFPKGKCYYNCRLNNETQLPILSTCNITELGCIEFIETMCNKEYFKFCKSTKQNLTLVNN